MNIIKKIVILIIVFFGIYCGRSRDVMENECKTLLAPFFVDTKGDQSSQVYDEKRFSLIVFYYGCMANAKRFGGEDLF